MMPGGSAAIPAWAEVQLPESIASNTPRQSLGTATSGVAGADGTVGCGTEGAGFAVAGVEPCDRGASGSDGCANTGAAEIKLPNASHPALKTDPPSKVTDL